MKTATAFEPGSLITHLPPQASLLGRECHSVSGHTRTQVVQDPGFHRIRNFVLALKNEQSSYTAPEQLRPRFLEAMATCSVVSFDIFDTSLVRHVDHALDVFLHLGRHPAFAAFSFARPVSLLRIEAEQTARSMVHSLIQSFEVTLLEIYQVFCDRCGISRDHAAAMMAAEEEIELALCVIHPAIYELYTEAKAAARKIIFVSDTYHDEHFLLRLLAAKGYTVTPEALFASSASRKAKQSGELFPLVLAALELDGAEVLHVGDHPVSDYKKALEAGLTAILHPLKASGDRPILFTLLPGLPPALAAEISEPSLGQESVLRGVARLAPHAAAGEGHREDFWWKFGYTAVGPLTVGFCQWLAGSLQADGIEHACFLLRDGALLHQVYQALYKDAPGACPATTLPSSRRATLMPALEIAPAFALPSLLGGIGLRPVREYLDRVQIPANSFLPEALAAGFTSLEERIDGRLESGRLLTLLVQPRVMSALIERSRVERSALLAFLDEEGVTAHRRVALVDLGWGGTIHKGLHSLFARSAPATHLTGYYMATFPESAHSVVPGLDVRSYLAHRGQPAITYDRILQFLNLFETVYSSTEGSLLYFEQHAPGSAATPVFQSSDKSPAQRRQLETMHAAAMAFAHDFAGSAASDLSVALPIDAAKEEFFRVIVKPTSEEALHLRTLVHCDNLGSASLHLAAAARETTDPAELLEDYRAAHWKQGLLALPTPSAAALRTMIWLLEMEGMTEVLNGLEA